MKSKINLLIAAISFITLLQGCSKGPYYFPPIPDDKLLLSKVTGQGTTAYDFFEYTRDSTRTHFNYSATYSYGSGFQGWDECKPMMQVGFANGGAFFYPPSPGGSWDITYKNFLPDKIIDNSKPGVDQGYWKLYYNNKGQVIKTGLAFTTTSEPTTFEFYQYDDHDNITAYVYGKNVDTPYYKNTYTYDAAGNLTQWQLLFANGYTNADAQTNQRIYSAIANSPETEKAVGKPFAAIMKKAVTVTSHQNSSTKTTFSKIPATTLGDSNVIYLAYYIGNISSDGKINPYHQQDRILFFITSRYYSADIHGNYRNLLKSNPLIIDNTVNPDFGTFVPMVSNYSYTYNNKGYPITSHEQTTDADGIWFGTYESYTEDRNYEYISNH